MNRDRMMGIAKRMLAMIDNKTTDLAPSSHREPVTAYTSPELFARERKAIFGRTPMFIGMSNEIPNPGDFFTRDFVDTPFLALRHHDGRVRLYLNACRHRGVKVALEPSGNAARFTCPFHAWSYDVDGSLVGMTEPEGFADVDRAVHGLIPLPVAEKYGMIFGCAAQGVEIDVDDILGGLGPELAEWGFERLTVLGEPHVHEVRGNWKYGWDTFCENYHFAVLHKKSAARLERRQNLIPQRQGFDVFGRNVRLISALRSIEELRGVPEGQWNPGEHISIQYRLYPSIAFSIYPDFIGVFWVLPGDHVSHARGLHINYVFRQPTSDEAATSLNRALRYGCKDVIDDEDFWITGLAEAGIHAPSAPASFVIGSNEPAIQHFHRLFSEQAV